MNIKMPKAGYVLLILFISLVLLKWLYAVDPVQKSKEMLEAGDISKLVQYYNNSLETVSVKRAVSEF